MTNLNRRMTKEFRHSSFPLGGDQRECEMYSVYRPLMSLIAIVWLILPDAQIASADTFAKATKLYQAGQWQQAADTFDAAATQPLQREARRRQAQLYAGESLLKLGKYAQARQRYQLVRHHAPSAHLEAQTLFRLGEIAMLSGERSEAVKLLRQYVETYPQGKSIGYVKKYLKQTESLQTKQVSFEVLEQAVSFQREEQFDAALAAYRELLQPGKTEGSVRAEAIRRSAQLHERLAQRQEAIQLYQQYLTEFPGAKRTTELLRAIAWNHVRLDQITQASEQFQTLVSNFPQSAQAAEAAYWLAQHCADDNHSEQALRLLELAISENTSTREDAKLRAKAVCLKCQLLAKQEQWPQIEQLAETEHEKTAEAALSTQMEFWSAESAFRQRKYEVARKRFIAIEPKLIGKNQNWIAMVPLRRAQLAARRQQWTEVLKLLDRLEQDHPKFKLDYEVDYLRGRALAGQGAMTAARNFYRRVTANPRAKQTEATTMAGWMIGETYFHQRNYPQARAAYETVMNETLFPEWQSRAALQAGKCWELEQRWEEASRVYANALQRWPNSFSDDQLQSRLRWAEQQTETTTQ